MIGSSYTTRNVNIGNVPQLGSGALTVATLNLPASYMLTGTVDFSDEDGPAGLVGCQLLTPSFVDDTVTSVPGYAGKTGWAEATLNGLATLSGAGTASVQCYYFNNTEFAGRARLTAVQVASTG